MNATARKLLAEAKRELGLAEKVQTQADAHKWAAAERMWKVNKEEGVSQQEIGRAVGTSQDTVSIYVRIYDGRRKGTYAGTFTEAYYEVRAGATPEDREERAVDRVARERPEVIARALTKQPRAAAVVTEHVTEELPEARAAAVRGSEKKRRLRESHRAKEKKVRYGARYVVMDGHLAKAKAALVGALTEGHGVEWGEEERALLADSLANVKAVLILIEAVLIGAVDVDWDAEFARLTEEGR